LILVEAPNFQLYQHWRNTQQDRDQYTYVNNEDWLRGYHGEVIVLNGGSQDPHIRSLVRRLEVAGQLTVSRRTV
jgi:hypothetical protein